MESGQTHEKSPSKLKLNSGLFFLKPDQSLGSKIESLRSDLKFNLICNM